MPQNTLYIPAKQAADQLNISISSLYSYVSRGLIRSQPSQQKNRQRLYSTEDITQLQQKKQLRQQPSVALKQALHWGEPILDTRISRIEQGVLYYRQNDIIQSINQYTFEQIASLLWTDSPKHPINWKSARIELKKRIQETNILPPSITYDFTQQAQSYLLFLEKIDQQSLFSQPNNVIRIGTNCLLTFCHLITGHYPHHSLAQHFCQYWHCQNQTPLIEAALILCADHELNASTFTGRCIASTGASAYQVINGALSAFSGPKHGGITKHVAHFWEELQRNNAAKVITERQMRNESIPGFDHPLYPSGDPRAHYLLTLLNQQQYPISNTLHSLLELMAQHQHYPTIDLALVAIEKALNLPQGSATLLFIIGRTVGWIAHAIEQYETNQLIRPRAGQ